MVEVNVTYDGGLRCRAKHGPSGVELTTDAPKDNMGKGEAFSPTDLVATALATCIATTMAIVANRKGYDLPPMTVHVEKHMTSAPPRRIERLPVVVTIPLPEDHPDRELLEGAGRGCPVHRSLHPDVQAPIEFVWNG
ncbi:OsmC family protein [Verrucomicrobium sp. BvORR106]|uniref:OsmC family protein n=1 Tax=Verrucomicrobium sp. BvORR106 TaxID=1403819 RepID=UPI000570B5D9|nr:OsmC family protein [Verrucomicrobium sp. BvORR106]